MLFKLDKQKSLSMLQLLAAIFILVAPSVIGSMPLNTGIYLLAIVLMVISCIRLDATERVVGSVNLALYLVLGIYALLSFLWVGNKEGHLLFIFSIMTVMAFHILAGDYFSETASEGIKRRLMYLISISGIICATVNVCYWIFKIVPVGEKYAFRQGIATNNFLGIFMFFAIFSSMSLLKGNSKGRRIVLIIASIGMLFVFMMAKSSIAWIFAILFMLVYFSKLKFKSEKAYMTVSIASAAFFLMSAAVMLSFTGHPTAFADTFNYALRHFYGLGGGFWSAKEIFSASTYPALPHTGLLIYLFATSGIIGVIAAALLLLRNLILFLKLKNMVSFAGLMLCIAIMILPFATNITVVLFWIGINAYNEQAAGMNFKIQPKRKIVKKTNQVALVVLIVSAMLLSQTFLRISAKNAYKNKDYQSSYELYKIAASLNLTDGESCRKAIISLRKAGNVQPLRDDALRIIDKAIKRDRNNLENIKEKALLYDACGEFELSAQEFRTATGRSMDKDRYNLFLVKELYKIVEKYPKGSSETKRAYEEILAVAQTTSDLDCKKEINDIADKAFKFTKGELSSEGQVDN